ncbi:MAG: TonB-dependent receptor, partial [Sphingobacteriales bacterium]
MGLQGGLQCRWRLFILGKRRRKNYRLACYNGRHLQRPEKEEIIMAINLRGILLLITFLTASYSCVYAQECGSTAIDDAEGLYNAGKFDESLTRLNTCLNSNSFNYQEKVQSYRLMAMSYLAMDSTNNADDVIRKMLSLKNNFDVDPRDPDRFRIHVTYVRTMMQANLTSSVSKKAEDIELAPATISIITAQDILDRGYINIEQLFHDLPGFDISRTSGLTYAVMFQRGYRGAANTDRTMLLVDGVEDNEMWSNSAFLTRQYALSNIKRVEVIYGPASTIYGANAFVGVINIITKGAEDYFKTTNAREDDSKLTKYRVTGQFAGGSMNSGYGDVTVAMKKRDLFFSVTGRLYKGNDTDLSGYSDWDGKWTANDFAPHRYDSLWTKKFSQKDYDDYKKKDPTGKYFTLNADGSKIIPTPAAIARADSLDQANYKKGVNGQSTAFTDPVKDYSVAAKLQFGDFKIGLQYQAWSEGVSPDYVDKFFASSADLTRWGARQTYFYARYDRNLSERLNFTSFTYYRSSDFGNDTHTTQYFGYANANLSFSDFLSGTAPNFRTTYFSQQSEQFRTDNRVNYVISEKIDVNFGVELRKGLFQGDYIRSATEDPITTGTAVAGIKGGNYYSVFDAAAYTQVSYQDRPRKLNLSVGGRMDHNRINGKFGYGTVFNPRFSAVYYPGKFIFKGIYSEAFLDASIFNKFSTSAIRLLNNPTLEPERVKNFELSARFTPSGKNYIQVSYYNARYSNILAQVNGVLFDTLGTRTAQFQAIGQSRIQGVQAAAEYFITNSFSLFGNATY